MRVNSGIFVGYTKKETFSFQLDSKLPEHHMEKTVCDRKPNTEGAELKAGGKEIPQETLLKHWIKPDLKLVGPYSDFLVF